MAHGFKRRWVFAAPIVIGSLNMPAFLNAAPKNELIYIGMHGEQIHAAQFDPTTGDITMVGPVANNLRPTWAIRHPKLPIIYFNEDAGNNASGGVQAFSVNRKTGALSKISDVRTCGAGTTHLWLDRPSMTLFAANYGGGSLSALPVRRDGTLGEAMSVTQFSGSGPHKRQSSAHAHGVSVDPSGQWVLVTDLGSDRIWVLPFDRTTKVVGPFDPKGQEHFIAPPGTAPRHMAWHPNNKLLYVVDELTATVDTFGFNPAMGLLTKLQSLSTDAADFTGDKSAAEVGVSRDGRFVYASNRGDHKIVVHSVDVETGMLTQIQRISSGGPWPWHFSIHSNGKWMLVANRDSNSVNVLSIDPLTGMLSDSGKMLATPKPVHVLLIGR